ncbi:putative UPF0668 protein C10orf76 [Paratrimastix pyriformis]|uniref:UPF0668 protein C10orf76 n=1 Tax=Paratrimastix pyriformis TaxID=342808 RepID=A0ABQ8UQV7_9EUKA|nr:putative UPF0668 protein C10orf76 [Paratrimastix pyriformis]
MRRLLNFITPAISKAGEHAVLHPTRSAYYLAFERILSGETGEAFWTVFFGIPVDGSAIASLMGAIPDSQLHSKKASLNDLFSHCVGGLASSFNQPSYMNSIQTLVLGMQQLFRKHLVNFSFDCINYLCGMEEADGFFGRLFTAIQTVLLSDEPSSTKLWGMHALLLIATATENIHQNSMLEFLLTHDLFPAVMRAAESGEQPLTTHAYGLLVVLSSYQRYEIANLYVHHIAHAEDARLFQAVAAFCNGTFAAFVRSQTPRLLLSQGPRPPIPIPLDLHVALNIFYQFVYTCPPFVEWLGGTAQSSVDRDPNGVEFWTNSPEPPVALLRRFLMMLSILLQEDFREFRVACLAKVALLGLLSLCESSRGIRLLLEPDTGQPVECLRKEAGGRLTVTAFSGPGSLAVAGCFLVGQFMGHHLRKGMPELDLYRKGATIIHRLLVQAHRTQTVLRAPLDWAALWEALLKTLRFVATAEERAQGAAPPDPFPASAPSPPPASASSTLLTLLNKLEQHQARLGVDGMFEDPLPISHRGSRTCPEIRFFEASLGPTHRTIPTTRQGGNPGGGLQLCAQLLDVLDIFLVFGEHFLPEPALLDTLFYEIIRAADAITTLVRLAESFRVGALSRALVNPQAIIQHFLPRVEQWRRDKGRTGPSPSQIVAILHEGYKTLTLRFHGNYEGRGGELYIENPREVTFFQHLIRTQAAEIRTALQGHLDALVARAGHALAASAPGTGSRPPLGNPSVPASPLSQFSPTPAMQHQLPGTGFLPSIWTSRRVRCFQDPPRGQADEKCHLMCQDQDQRQPRVARRPQTLILRKRCQHPGALLSPHPLPRRGVLLPRRFRVPLDHLSRIPSLPEHFLLRTTENKRCRSQVLFHQT